MRIGIITFHCSYNFGSALQTYALQRLLELRGNDVQVIDYRSRDYRYYSLFRLARPRTMLDNLLGLSGNVRRKDSFERFISESLSLTSETYSFKNEDKMKELADYYDCFVCGSDQIWNLDCTKGPVGPFFLSFAGDRRRVAYAPSLAHSSFDQKNFTEADKKYIGAQLDKFFAISVREESTVPLFQSLTRNQIDVCLDPTLLLDGGDYRPIVSQVSIEGPFVFAYMLEENPVVMLQAECVAREMGAKVVYVSARNRRFSVPSINLYGIGPSEFLGLMSRAEAVVTNSFHATVFSLLFGTPFQTVATRNSGSRMKDLLTLLGEEHHLIENVCEEMPTAAALNIIGSKLEAHRERSLAFLKRALEE